jgi:polar amino acid transport system substrate-binding protein
MFRKMVYTVFCILIFSTGNLYAETVVLGNGEWKPYQSEELKNGGFCTDVVRKAFDKEGIDTEFKWYGSAWKRAFSEASENKIDGTLVWSHKDEREEVMYYSKEAVLSGKKDFIYFLKNGEKFNSVEDLYGKRVGGVLGYTYGPEIDKALEDGKFTIDRTNSEEKNFKKLLLGRVDCLIAGQNVAEEILNDKLSKDEKNKITKSEKPTRVVTYHLLLNKKNPGNKKRMETFDQGLKKIKDEGVYDDLVNKLESGWYEK